MLSAAERLLLDIYSSVNEPDGLYAVTRSHSALSQLRRAEHGELIACHIWPIILVKRLDIILATVPGKDESFAGPAATSVAKL